MARTREDPGMKLSAVIMAHPDRRARAEAVQARLDRPTEIVWDETHNVWDTGRRAMLAYDPECTHHAVVQDDVLVPRDLLAGIERALEHVPEGAPLGGYIGRIRPCPHQMEKVTARANRHAASWIVLPEPIWGPLIVVPTACIPEMVEFCKGLTGMRNYDLRISRYFVEKQIDVWFPWPSIVDHADGPSLIIGRSATDRRSGQTRVAYKFCGEDTSVLDLDFSGPIIR